MYRLKGTCELKSLFRKNKLGHLREQRKTDVTRLVTYAKRGKLFASVPSSARHGRCHAIMAIEPAVCGPSLLVQAIHSGDSVDP